MYHRDRLLRGRGEERREQARGLSDSADDHTGFVPPSPEEAATDDSVSDSISDP
jgi:hypothetical protein